MGGFFFLFQSYIHDTTGFRVFEVAGTNGWIPWYIVEWTDTQREKKKGGCPYCSEGLEVHKLLRCSGTIFIMVLVDTCPVCFMSLEIGVVIQRARGMIHKVGSSLQVDI